MASKVSGHLQVRGHKGQRRWHALWRDEAGRHQKVLGFAHVKDYGKRTGRGAVVWRAADGPKPSPEHLTISEAQQALDELLARAWLEPPEPPAPRVPNSSIRTLGDAQREWLRHVEFDKARRASTVMDYRAQTKRYLLDELGADLPLDELTTEVIEAWQQELLERGHLSRRTIQKAQVCLHAMLKRSSGRRKRSGWPSTPRRTPTGSPEAVRRLQRLSVEDAEALFHASLTDLEAAIYPTAIGAGLRMGELRALRWRDVDFTRRLIHVRWAYSRHRLERPKSSSVRSVPMADQVATALDRLSRRERFVSVDDYVFCTPLGAPADDIRTRRAFYAALERAGLGHLRT